MSRRRKRERTTAKYPAPNPAMPGNFDRLTVFLSAAESAAWLGVSPVTLCRWQIEGRGPPFRKFGRRVLYAQVDLVVWADAQKRLSTSSPGTP